MHKAPHELKAGDLIVGNARCLLKVTETAAVGAALTIGTRVVRTTFVSPFTVCEELTLDGAAMVDVWDDSGTGV